MRQSLQTICGKTGALSASLLLLCCSSHRILGSDAIHREQPDATTNGGKGSSLRDGAADTDTPASGGGGGGTKATTTGGAGGQAIVTVDAGAPGAGGQDGATKTGYGLYVLPGLAPAELDRNVLTQGSSALSTSADGKLLGGISGWQQFASATTADIQGTLPFVWTPNGGSLSLPQISPTSSSNPVMVAKGGGAVFGATDEKAAVQQLVRWTPTGGGELFDLPMPPTVSSAIVTAVAFDGSAAMVDLIPASGPVVSMLWRQGENGNHWVKPAQRLSFFSDDGSVVFAQAFVGSSPNNNVHVYRALLAPGPLLFEEIKQPNGYSDCQLRGSLNGRLASANGSVVAGVCGYHNDSPVMFRWREGDTAMTIVSDGPVEPQVMTPDGGNVIGAGKVGDHYLDPSGLSGLTWWTPAGSVHVTSLSGSEVVGVADDGSFAWVNGYGAAYGALRWARATGLVPLAVAPNTADGNISSVSSDGTVAVGVAAFAAPGRATYPTHTMLWDTQGVRDITQELIDAGFAELGTPMQQLTIQSRPTAVWPGASIRIQGDGGIFGDTVGTWIATVPSR